MIKKEYIQPEAKEVKLILPSILIGSTEQTEQVNWSEEITEEEDIA